MTWLLNLLKQLFSPHYEPIQAPISPVEPPKTPTPMPPSPTNTERLYSLAKNCLGRDIAKTQNELGCAEAVSYLLMQLKIPNFPPAGFLSTSYFYYWLRKYGKQVDTPTAGNIVISPTGASTKGALHGHIGVVGLHGILSNNSMTGIFDEYYTLDKWNVYYKDKLGFPILFFEV